MFLFTISIKFIYSIFIVFCITKVCLFQQAIYITISNVYSLSLSLSTASRVSRLVFSILVSIYIFSFEFWFFCYILLQVFHFALFTFAIKPILQNYILYSKINLIAHIAKYFNAFQTSHSKFLYLLLPILLHFKHRIISKL